MTEFTHLKSTTNFLSFFFLFCFLKNGCTTLSKLIALNIKERSSHYVKTQEVTLGCLLHSPGYSEGVSSGKRRRVQFSWGAKAFGESFLRKSTTVQALGDRGKEKQR